MNEIQSKLKEFRIKQGLSQGQLAAKLGVTRQTINAIEQGKYQPSLSLAYQCAKYFHTTIEVIFNLK